MKALSFFTGAMGMDLGMEACGFDVLLAAEINKHACETIRLNRPSLPIVNDVSLLTRWDVRKAAKLSKTEEIDVIYGGPPCQAFSTVGKRQGFNDKRGNVFLDYIDLVLKLEPKYLVIENVRGLLSASLEHRPHNERGINYPPLKPEERKGGALKEILRRLRKGGYAYSFNLYNAANFGTPQIRERVVLIASLIKPPYLVPTCQKWQTFEECTQGLVEADAKFINFPAKRLEFYKLLGPGQNWRNLPKKLQLKAMGGAYYSGGGKTGFYRRLAWDKPSPTLVTHPAMPATDLAHPEQNRPLSIQEYKRIQQFPDDWKIAGKLLEQYKQVGNAVPVGFAKAIGSMIKDLLEGKSVSTSSQAVSRYKNCDDKSWETAQQLIK